MTNKQQKEKKMKTVKEETGGTSFINVIGGILIAFAAIDFLMLADLFAFSVQELEEGAHLLGEAANLAGC